MSSRFPCVIPGMERFLLDLRELLKKIENVLWKWGLEVRSDHKCAEFVTAN